MSTFLDRSIKLLGEEKINSFKDKNILIVGIGGVGGTALEALARSGFQKFTIIDFDVVDITNLNRQILFTNSDVGKSKVECAKRKILDINPDADIKTFDLKVEDGTLDSFDIKTFDFIIDAIDYIPGKLHLMKVAQDNNICFISSLGMGNKIDPEKVTLTTLNKTENDPLAKKIRYEARKIGIDLKTVNVVFSKEEPLIKSPKPASLIMVPSTAGLLIAKYVLSTIL